MTETITKSMDDIVALCRRRGFIWQSSEIYGGINGFWDYGPLGAMLKKNLKDAWWHDIIACPPDGPDGKPLHIVPLDTTIISNPQVWVASGHVGGFNDPMVDDKETKQRFRADHLQGFFKNEKFGPEAEPEKLATQLLGQYDSVSTTFPPIRTIVANSFQEAFQMLRSEKALQKRLGLRVLDGKICDDKSALLLVQEREFVFTVGVRAISMNELTFSADELPSPFTNKKSTLTSPQQFNLMFFSYAGAVFNEENKVYLRPETAQGIFTQFWNVVDTSRVKVPFGIAQQGKAFRNEVTPRNFTFRSREFEQMEIEFFIHPDEAHDWYQFWRDHRYAWWQSIGLAGDNLQLREHESDELAHYAKEGAGTSDIEYRFPFTAPGFGELEGVAHRADYDLRAHATACGKGDKMMYFDQERGEKGERYFPHVIEPSAGADRGVLAILCEAFTPTPDRAGSKYVMNFHPRMAPIKAGIFPLVNKEGMPEIAEKLYNDLRRMWSVQLDIKQAIGKRYARMDEAGTPFCFTIDGDTLTDNTVTVRDRDTASQDRISIDKVREFLAERIGS